MASQKEHVEVLKYLVETCGKELLRDKSNGGQTCAHWASAVGDVEVLMYLVETDMRGGAAERQGY